MKRRIEILKELMGRFDDLPPEVFYKEDLLRLGMSLGWPAASVEASADAYQHKSYFIFSFDRTPIGQMAERENLRAPEEIALVGGPRGLRRTIVSVRLNPASPYRLVRGEAGCALYLEDELVSPVELPPVPAHYQRSLSSGKPIAEIAPVIEWGYLIYLTVFRRCQYVGTDQECRFCDINANFDQQRASGRTYTTVKGVDEIMEALEIVVAEEQAAEERGAGERTAEARRSKAYTLTGGSVTGTLRGAAESDFYVQYAEAIEKRFPGRWIGKAVVQALPKEDLRKFRDAGIRIYHPNYEVWDARLFEWLCPGKTSYIGRRSWIERVLEAREVFGAAHVIPNFVGGVEMARPHGFTTVEEAVRSTTEGLEFFMSRGVTPRFTTWCPEPLSNLGSQEPAPLEYHLRLLQSYRDTLAKHRLAAPSGYGSPGIGNAVFSVSSFMDVLPAVPSAQPASSPA